MWYLGHWARQYQSPAAVLRYSFLFRFISCKSPWRHEVSGNWGKLVPSVTVGFTVTNKLSRGKPNELCTWLTALQQVRTAWPEAQLRYVARGVCLQLMRLQFVVLLRDNSYVDDILPLTPVFCPLNWYHSVCVYVCVHFCVFALVCSFVWESVFPAEKEECLVWMVAVVRKGNTPSTLQKTHLHPTSKPDIDRNN